MRANPWSGRRTLLVAVGLGVVTTAAAQRFVWPPASGDRAAETATPAAANQPAAIETPAQFAAPRAASEPALGLAARPDGFTGRAVTAAPAPNFPVAPAAGAAGGRLDWRILENPKGPHAAFIFDPVRQVFAVYHVDAATGQIMLKSVRNLSADLQLDQFNSSNPAPKDIQGMLNEAR